MTSGVAAPGQADVAATVVPATRTVSLREIESTLWIVQVPPLAPDLGYNLDAAAECGDITCDERCFVDLHDTRFRDWFDDNLDRPDDFVPEIRRRHAAWRAIADPCEILGLDWAGLLGLAPLFDDACRGVVHEAAQEAAALGGTEAALEGAVTGSGDTGSARAFLALALPLVRRVEEDVVLHGIERFLAARDVVSDAYEARNAVARAARERRVGDDPRPPRAARPRRTDRGGRRILARSLDLLGAVAGRSRARAWLSGDEIVVEGNVFDFRVRLVDHRRTTHGAMDVSVTDKASVELARLCVYAPDTPALDQIASLVLHVTSGEEDGILAAANVIRYSAEGRGHEHLRRIRGSRDPVGTNPDPDPRLVEEGRLSELLRPRVRMAFGQAVRAAFMPFAPSLGDAAWIDAVIDARLVH